MASDITAFHLGQKDWQEKGAGRPEVLKSFARPQDFIRPEYDLGFMYFDGYLVVDHEGQPLEPFRSIPLTLSSKIEGWRAEAIRRSDPRIRNTDLIARMPVKVDQSANDIPTRTPLVQVNAVVGRQSRFREKAGAITWGRPTAENMHSFLWSLLPQHCRDNNLALPRDLTQQERGKLRALNVGSNPAKARKVAKGEKGTTREQYIDGVRNRAAGLPPSRGDNPRRLRKVAVRAAREARSESLPNESRSPQDELEPALDYAALPGAAGFDLKYSATPALQAYHQPAFAAPAIVPVFAASTAPAAPAAPAPSAAPTIFAAPATCLQSGPPQFPVRAPPIRGPVNPPFPFVVPGEYLLDDIKFYK